MAYIMMNVTQWMNGEKRMKGPVVACIILYAVILVSTLKMPVAEASINNYNWIGAVTRNS